MTPDDPQRRTGPGVACLWAAGVQLVATAPDEVVVAGFARNVERVVAVLRQWRAQALLADDTEQLEVPITAELLRGSRRTGWALWGGARVHVAFEPAPGLDFGALLLDAPSPAPGEDGPPWACAAHRELLAERRSWRRPGEPPGRAAPRYTAVPGDRRTRAISSVG